MPSNERKRAERTRQIFYAIFFVVGLSVFFWYLSHLADTWSLLRGEFVSADGRKSGPLLFSIASTEAERAKGLMFVKTLPPDRGMLFVFPDEQKRKFWMRNTYVSLDIIFLDKFFRVVGIERKMPILSDEARGPDQPAMYVIELVAGSADRLGIQVGDIFNPKGPIPKGLPSPMSFQKNQYFNQ
jgi:uncharacterized membrane protein (UPF0127 family)